MYNVTSHPLKEVNIYGEDKAQEAVDIFRQLNPENQRYFMMMVRTADIAERNAGRKPEDSESELTKE